MGNGSQPVFFYDLSSPYAYLAAYRVNDVLPVATRWQPVWIWPIVAAAGREWRRTGEETLARQMEVERRAADYGMPALRWPDKYLSGRELGMDAEPVNTLAVMRLATFADRAGVGQEFARRAYHLAFAEGHDISAGGDAGIGGGGGGGLGARAARAGGGG